MAAASFDAIVLTEVLEHVPDPPAVLVDLALRPGGRLFLTVPSCGRCMSLPHAEILAEIADHVEALGPLDVDRALPLGFAASATRSAA